ncbi:lysophospholipid acyltransferase 6 isoform X2 [Drosophila montana]|uniref:lysophospholipid acyltransferase 6 isoform X2 n=1 Tax=Drosophila montana TaxID=40370 RepID=UPI00313E3364
MLESPKFVENDLYDGSRMFTWLADAVGLSVDLVNFLICQMSALFLASLFRSWLHPSKVSYEVRHVFAMSLGLAFGYFCFGQQAIHIAGLPALCYIVIRTQDPRIVQRSVLLVAMGYLLCVHLMRQIYDYGSYALDITGPLMIITQKVTSLAFSIHDGFVRQDEDLTRAQKYHAIRKMPTALEFFSYVWHFQSLMAGPLVFYKDYIEFVEGYNLLKRPASNASLDNGKTELVVEPSPTKTVIRKVLGSMVCAFIFMKFVKIYPVKNMKEDDFINGTSIPYKFWYAMMATTCIRFKYYHAWLLADAICNNSGLGFTGYDKDGNAKWDLISNINVLSFEFASNMRDAINNWNCGTNRWLRTLVYERVPKQYGTLLTFALSAVWHGFYPGYYLTFATGALMVTAARTARRMLRYRFQSTQFTRMFYDILTIITTRIVMGYTTFPFVLLEFMGSMKLYLRFFLCLHIISLVTIFILPRFIRGEQRSAAGTSLTANISDIATGTAEAAAEAAAVDPLAVDNNTHDLNVEEEQQAVLNEPAKPAAAAAAAAEATPEPQATSISTSTSAANKRSRRG